MPAPHVERTRPTAAHRRWSGGQGLGRSTGGDEMTRRRCFRRAALRRQRRRGLGQGGAGGWAERGLGRRGATVDWRLGFSRAGLLPFI
jgi:hypothetical protein